VAGARDRVEARIALQAGVPLVVALVLAGAIFVLAGAAFAESFLANFLATVLGVLAAIPVTLWLDRFVEAQHRGVEITEQTAATTARRTELLELIRDELVANREALSGQAAGKEARTYAAPFLATESWDAIRDGGEVEFLTKLDTLRDVERAYRFIRTNVFLAEREMEATLSASEPQSPGSPAERWRTVLAASDGEVVSAIDTALERVRADLAAAAREPVG
jgi:hypothetical protein